MSQWFSFRFSFLSYILPSASSSCCDLHFILLIEYNMYLYTCTWNIHGPQNDLALSSCRISLVALHCYKVQLHIYTLSWIACEHRYRLYKWKTKCIYVPLKAVLRMTIPPVAYWIEFRNALQSTVYSIRWNVKKFKTPSHMVRWGV